MLEQKKGIRTINKSMTLLKSLFNYAVIHGWVARNPAIGIKQLRDKDPNRENHFQSHVLKPEELRALLNTYDPNHERWKIIVEVAALTGLREGELLGLRWSDINWKTKQLQLERQYTKGRFCGLKTFASRRSVDISDDVALRLKRWWLACPKGPLGLVFPNGSGKPENHGNLLRRGFYPFLQKAGLRKIRFHDLRHGYASLLIMNGEHPKFIQQQMGHSSVKVTMDIYGHLMASSNPQAAEKLSKLIYGQDVR
jgi:integrase